MNTTGNPGSGESGSGPEPAGDYGYSGGYGYGPGYGDPDGGAGYSYGQPGYADLDDGSGYGSGAHYAGAPGDAGPAGGYPPAAGAGAGRSAAANAAAEAGAPPLPPVVADTPALRGHPGGPGLEGLTEAAGGRGGGEPRGLASPTVWQEAQRAWRAAGVEWQRPVTDGEPAEAEWERVQAASPGKRRGAAGKAAWPAGVAAGRLGSRISARALTRSLRGPLQPPGGSALTPAVPGTAASPETAAGQGEAVGQTAAVARAVPGAVAGPADPAVGPADPAVGAGTAAGSGTAGGPSVATAAPPGATVGPAGVPVRPGDAPFQLPGTSFGPPDGPGRARRGLWLAVVAAAVAIVLGVAGLLVFGGGSPARTGAAAAYPPARLAGADFTTTPGQQGRGIFQSVSGVAASGATVVAVGSQAGQWIPRAQFFTSADGGRSWRMATVRGPGGAAPSPADLPVLVAGGPPLPGGRGGWLALGTGAAWTSPDGRTWTLAPGAGVGPLQASDHVLALARTAGGFVAVGENEPASDPAASSPVAWESANGLNWRRLSAGALRLTVPGGRVTGLTHVAARGGHVIVVGVIVSTHGSGKHRTTSASKGIWFSANGGLSWAAAHVPFGSSEASLIDGVATTGSGFVVVRSGGGKIRGSDAVAYVSQGGSYWSRAATIIVAKNAHLHVTAVGGSDQGAAIAAKVAGGARVAFVSTDGTTWRSVANLGGSAQSLAGVTVTAGGTVVAAGATVRAADGQQPYLVLAGSQARTVSFGSIAGATGPSLGVSGIAVAGGTTVAVGSADGYPAIWSAGRSGGWRRVGSAALARPGPGALAGVVHGSRGWLAVGGVAAGALSRPAVVVSATAGSWQAADGEAAFAGPGIAVSAAAAGRSGYVIVGRQVVPGRTFTKSAGTGGHNHVTTQVIPPQTIAAAWWSAGLTGWARGTGVTAGDLSGTGSPQMLAVAAAGTRFVAVGSDSHSPAVWTSPDGRRWQLTRLRPPAGASTALLQQVAARRNVIVATGTATTGAGTEPFAAYSTDGGTIWQETPLTAPGGFPAVTALTAAGRGFEAVGTVGQPGNLRVVVWSSRDGISWKTHEPVGTGLSGRGSQALTALAASGSRLTGAGYVATPQGEQPTLWQATAAAG